MKTKLLTICLLLFSSQVFALEECKGTDHQKWDNCIGTYTFGPKSKWAGDQYVGAFKNGKQHGHGTYTFARGENIVGQFKDDKYVGK